MKLIPQSLIDAAPPRHRPQSRPPAPPRPAVSSKPAVPVKAKRAPRFPEYEARRRAEAEARGRATMQAIAEAARPVASVESAQPQPSSFHRVAREAAEAIVVLMRGGL